MSDPFFHLPMEQHRVAHLLADGVSPPQIAKELDIDISVLAEHIYGIRRNLSMPAGENTYSVLTGIKGEQTPLALSEPEITLAGSIFKVLLRGGDTAVLVRNKAFRPLAAKLIRLSQDRQPNNGKSHGVG